MTGDGPPAAPVVQRAVITIGGSAEPEDDDDDAIKPLPDRLVTRADRASHAGAARRLANNPHVAMTALLHKLCLDIFHTAPRAAAWRCRCACLLPGPGAGPEGQPAAKAVAERHEAWKADAEGRGRALGLARRSRRRRAGGAPRALRLVRRQCALREGRPLRRPGRLVPRRRAAHRPGRPAGAGRRSRHGRRPAGVRPSRTISAGSPSPASSRRCARAPGEQAAQLIDHLKKADMAKEAERLLADTGWLPEPLRLIPETE